jgi:hypothetical protein
VKKSIVWIVAIVAVGVVGFIAGMQLGPSIKGTTTTTAGNARPRGQFPEGFTPPAGMAGQPGAGMRGGGVVVGKVVSSDDKSITVKLAQGGSQTVYVSSSTVYNELAKVGPADVSVGTTITASGTAADDGSVTARTIMIGSLAGFGGFRGDGPAPAPGP